MKLKWALLSFFIVQISISGDGLFWVCDKRCVNENKKYEKLPQFNSRGAKKIECWLRMLQAEKEFM